MVATRNELRLLGLLALLVPLYGAIQLWLQSEPSTRVEVRTITEPVPVRVEVPVQVEVPVERIVFVPVPTIVAGAEGDEDAGGSADFPPVGVVFVAQAGGGAAAASGGTTATGVPEDQTSFPTAAAMADTEMVGLELALETEPAVSEPAEAPSLPARPPIPPIISGPPPATLNAPAASETPPEPSAPARSPGSRQPTIFIVGNPGPFLQPAPVVGAPAVSAAPLITGVAGPSEAEGSAPNAVAPSAPSQFQSASPALVRASDVDNDDERQAGRRGERRDSRRKNDEPRAPTDEREGPEAARAVPAQSTAAPAPQRAVPPAAAAVTPQPLVQTPERRSPPPASPTRAGAPPANPERGNRPTTASAPNPRQAVVPAGSNGEQPDSKGGVKGKR